MNSFETTYTQAKKEKDEIIEGCIQELQQNKERIPIEYKLFCGKEKAYWEEYRYVVKDPAALTQKLEDTPWVVGWLMAQIRTDVIMRPSFVNSNVSFLEWVVACAFPLFGLVKPMIQKFISDVTIEIAKDAWSYTDDASYTRLDRTMLREAFYGSSVEWSDETRELGMNPITWYLIQKRIANLDKPDTKPFPKDAEVHPRTEELYVTHGTLGKTYKETLLKADNRWKEKEEEINTGQPTCWLFREEVAVTFAEAILSYDGLQAPANKYLLERSLDKSGLDGSDLIVFAINFESTYAWVQYIRALVDDAPEDELKRAADLIVSVYSKRNESYEHEMWFLFDAIHRIFINV
jgi:hypothetical protein